MSKNTQISELINYISVDGSGNIVFTTVPAASSNTDKFLVSDAGVLKFRTAAQLLSDIGAQASGSYQAALSGTGFVKISGTTISYDNSTYLTTSSAGTTYVPYTGATSSLDVGTNDLSGRYLNANGSAGLGGVLHLRQDAAYLARGNGYSTIASSGTLFQFFAYTGATTYKDFALRYDGLTNNTTRIYTLPDATGTLALTSNLSGMVTGTGTNNYIPKFTSTGSTIGNSVVYDNGSQIGISQTTLFVKFSISDSLAATSVGSNYNPGIINIQNTNTTNGNLSLIGFQDASAFINLAAFGAINEVHSSSPNNVKGSLAFYTKNNGTSYVIEKMRLTASGNLGIGVADPDTTLEVRNPNLSTDTVNTLLTQRWSRQQTGAVKWGNSMDLLLGSYESGIISSRTRVDFRLANGNTDDPDTTVLTLQGNGNVGIGTVTPSLALNVIGQIRAGYADNVGITFGLSPVGVPNNDNNAYILWGDTTSFGGNNGDLIYVPRTSTTAAHRFYTGNSSLATEKFTIDNNGKVGIGEISPDNSYQGLTIKGTDPSLRLKTTSGSGWVWTEYVTSTGVNNFSMGVNQTLPYFGIKAGAGLDNPNFSMTTNGNVGIGTVAPNNKLTVWTSSTTGLQTALRLNNPFGFTGVNTGAKIVFSQDRSTSENLPMGEMGVGQEAVGTSDYGYMFFSTLNGTMNEKVRITSDGVVLVGSQVSDYGKLSITVNPSSYTAALGLGFRTNSGEGNSVGISFKTKVSLSGGIWENARIAAITEAITSSAYGSLAFYTMSATTLAEKMRINSDYNILFNTISSSPTNTSSFIFRSGITAYSGVMIINHATTNNTGAGYIDCFYNTSYIGGIQQNGASNVAYYTSSDYRLKEDLKDFDGLNLISSLKVYDFKWKAEDSRMYGVLAHELQEVVPYIVSGNKDEIKENGKIKVQVVDYSKIVPVLIKSIQELTAKVNALENK